MTTEGKNILVCGRTGSGKSYLVKRAIATCPRLLVYSTKREETDYPGVTFDGLENEWPALCAAWGYFHDRHGRFRLIYRPKDAFDPMEFDRVCRLVYACGDVVLVCEEVMTYTTEHQVGQGTKTLLTAGRTRKVTTYLITQRPFKIPREITSQAREAFIFATHERGDVEYVRATFGEQAAEALGKLNQYEHIRWLETGEVTIGKA